MDRCKPQNTLRSALKMSLFAHETKCSWLNISTQHMDGKNLFEPLDVKLSGIASSVPNPDVCHSKRMVSRKDLGDMHMPQGWQVMVPECFSDLPAHPKDVVMCCKQFWSDDYMAQPPTLVIPYIDLSQLDDGPREANRRKVMGETSLT